MAKEKIYKQEESDNNNMIPSDLTGSLDESFFKLFYKFNKIGAKWIIL